MTQRGMIVAVTLFVLIVIGMFVFAFLKKSELQTDTNPQVTTPTASPSPYDHITRVDAKHFFEEGTHTLVGEIMLPTRCDLLDWNSVSAESMPEQVTVNFVVINSETSCEPAEVPSRFVVTVTASEQATFRATFMEREVILNLIPPAPGETPEQFELYSKG